MGFNFMGFEDLRAKADDDAAVLIEHLLTEVESHLNDLHRIDHFIESLREQFDSTGRLTPKQIGALKTYYERI